MTGSGDGERRAQQPPQVGRRFWNAVTVDRGPDGFGVRLDDRPLRTPERRALLAPTAAFAEALAAEWRAVDGAVRPQDMPFTRAANAAIDRVAPEPGPVIDAIAAYGRSDLLCHRAASPVGLRNRQVAAWDPPLAWAAEALGARLIVVDGVMPLVQPVESLEALRGAIACEGAFALTALSEMTGLSGSVILGLAVARGRLAAEDAWAASQVDERWQAEQWGEDDVAAATIARNREDFVRAARMFELLSEAPRGSPAG